MASTSRPSDRGRSPQAGAVDSLLPQDERVRAPRRAHIANAVPGRATFTMWLREASRRTSTSRTDPGGLAESGGARHPSSSCGCGAVGSGRRSVDGWTAALRRDEVRLRGEGRRRIDVHRLGKAGPWELLLSALYVSLHVHTPKTRASWAHVLVGKHALWTAIGYAWLGRQALLGDGGQHRSVDLLRADTGRSRRRARGRAVERRTSHPAAARSSWAGRACSHLRVAPGTCAEVHCGGSTGQAASTSAASSMPALRSSRSLAAPRHGRKAQNGGSIAQSTTTERARCAFSAPRQRRRDPLRLRRRAPRHVPRPRRP